MQRFVTLETNSIEIQENVDTIKVMAHPVRLKILYELYKNKTLNVTQLTETLNIPPINSVATPSKNERDNTKRR